MNLYRLQYPGEGLPEFGPMSFVHQLVILDGIDIGLQIHIACLDKLCSLDQLPSHKHDSHNRQLDVVAHKVDATEGWAETAPALYEDENTVEDDSDPWSPWVSPVLEWKQVGLTLCFKAFAEPYRGDTN